jgi:hypothetical protein
LTVLEDDIREVYQQMNDRKMPASRISIPIASKRGRTRLRWRRVGTVGAPTFAASAVAVIATLAAVLTGTAKSHEPRPARQVAPHQFSPLRPYAWYEEPPIHPWSVDVQSLTAAQETLQFYAQASPRAMLRESSSAWLTVGTPGTCHVLATNLRCEGTALANMMINGHLGQRVGSVNGSPAYWQETHCARMHLCPSPMGSRFYPGSNPHDGTLRWQSPSGAWAALNMGTLRDALAISRAVRFGPTVAPLYRYPFQLTGMPAGWQVDYISGGQVGGILQPGQVNIAASPSAVWAASAWQIAVIPVPGTVCQGVSRSLDGWSVKICTGRGQNAMLVATAGRGGRTQVTVQIGVGTPSPISRLDLLEHHLRLFGANPRTWTTQPVR